MTLLPSPDGRYSACRACATALDLDADGFCLFGCSQRRVNVTVPRAGVYFEWAFVLFEDRALPFIVGAWVPLPDEASAHYGCLDLPALEEEAARLWRNDEAYRAQVIQTVEAVASRPLPSSRSATWAAI